MALDTSAESPAPVRTVSAAIADWVGRLGAIWVEGQVAQLTRRPGARQAWLVLRDVDVDMSLSVVASTDLLDGVSPRVEEGHRIVVQAKPEVYPGRAAAAARARRSGRSASARARAIGLRGLLARGPLRSRAQRPLPFSRTARPHLRRSERGMKDVMRHARLRAGGGVRGREVPVRTAVRTDVVAAIAELDRMRRSMSRHHAAEAASRTCCRSATSAWCGGLACLTPS